MPVPVVETGALGCPALFIATKTLGTLSTNKVCAESLKHFGLKWVVFSSACLAAAFKFKTAASLMRAIQLIINSANFTVCRQLSGPNSSLKRRQQLFNFKQWLRWLVQMAPVQPKRLKQS
jgi:hypothetical protein